MATPRRCRKIFPAITPAGEVKVRAVTLPLVVGRTRSIIYPSPGCELLTGPSEASEWFVHAHWQSGQYGPAGEVKVRAALTLPLVVGRTRSIIYPSPGCELLTGPSEASEWFVHAHWQSGQYGPAGEVKVRAALTLPLVVGRTRSIIYPSPGCELLTGPSEASQPAGEVKVRAVTLPLVVGRTRSIIYPSPGCELLTGPSEASQPAGEVKVRAVTLPLVVGRTRSIIYPSPGCELLTGPSEASEWFVHALSELRGVACEWGMFYPWNFSRPGHIRYLSCVPAQCGLSQVRGGARALGEAQLVALLLCLPFVSVTSSTLSVDAFFKVSPSFLPSNAPENIFSHYRIINSNNTGLVRTSPFWAYKLYPKDSSHHQP
ncbi:hypothetical protein J6590_023734 [Homalodisca vitripennis]|nr:hypothetical protein J6590_023734 [Homalodisca vitripennis]